MRIKSTVIMEDYKKKYEDALERAKKFIEENPCVQNLNTWIKETFPELVESGDEQIRKELIAWLQNTEGQVLPMDRYNAALAWLEKQGDKSDKKPDWSEKDEKILNKIIRKLDESNNVNHYDYADFEMWLIDLKERLMKK